MWICYICIDIDLYIACYAIAMQRRAKPPKPRPVRAGRERVLVEFPESLLRRADDAASELDQNRSELIRTAVERFLEELEKKKLELVLAAAYAANARMNVDLAGEFIHVDAEGF